MQRTQNPETTLKLTAPRIALPLLLLGCVEIAAHEGHSRVTADEGEEAAVEVGGDLFIGRHGYLHFGTGISSEFHDGWHGGLLVHAVREDKDGDFFPSLSAEVIRSFESGYTLEAFSFGYFPVEDQSAWALGTRLSKEFSLSSNWTISPFFGPSVAQVTGIDEITGEQVDVSHLMGFGGIELSAGRFEFTLFGSLSWFSKSVDELESVVDLEEMTHFTAYVNNDGFARASGGIEAAWQATKWLRWEARYAAIHFDDRDLRHSVMTGPEFQITPNVVFHIGGQLIRGADKENELIFSSISVRF